MTDYSKLRELAQASADGMRGWFTSDDLRTWLSHIESRDAEFIAAANPTVVLALLDELAALRRGQGTAPTPATPGTTPYHTTHPIPDSTGGTR